MFARIVREAESMQSVLRYGAADRAVSIEELLPCYLYEEDQGKQLRVILDPLSFLILVLSKLYHVFFQMTGVWMLHCNKQQQSPWPALTQAGSNLFT